MSVSNYLRKNIGFCPAYEGGKCISVHTLWKQVHNAIQLHTGAFITPHRQVCTVSHNCVSGGFLVLAPCLTKRPDTVGELKSAEIYVSDMPSWQALKLGKPSQEKVLLEH